MTDGRERCPASAREGGPWCRCPECGSAAVDILRVRADAVGITTLRFRFECTKCGTQSRWEPGVEEDPKEAGRDASKNTADAGGECRTHPVATTISLQASTERGEGE